MPRRPDGLLLYGTSSTSRQARSVRLRESEPKFDSEPASERTPTSSLRGRRAGRPPAASGRRRMPVARSVQDARSRAATRRIPKGCRCRSRTHGQDPQARLAHGRQAPWDPAGSLSPARRQLQRPASDRPLGPSPSGPAAAGARVAVSCHRQWRGPSTRESDAPGRGSMAGRFPVHR